MSMRSGRSLKKLMLNSMTAWMALAGVALTPASGQQSPQGNPPNGVPLMFGMRADEVSQALGVPLNYVRGRSGDELFLATSNVKGSALSSRSDGLYLQFRKGRLAGWKGDWGTVTP
ncbi:MAG: hypothetical protein ACLQDM_24040 [Bradyrhizobium sp.]